MRNFLNDLFIALMGAAFVTVFVLYLVTDTREVEGAIIRLKASVAAAF